MILRDSLVPSFVSNYTDASVMRITVEYASEWNMQRERRYERINQLARVDLRATEFTRTMLARIFAKYIIYDMVVGYPRG